MDREVVIATGSVNVAVNTHMYVTEPIVTMMIFYKNGFTKEEQQIISATKGFLTLI